MTNQPEHPPLSPLVQKFINEFARKYSPNFTIRNKAHKDGLYAVASFFGKIFNPEIDTRYLTQVLHECWLPPHMFEKDDISLITTLAHETMHERDRKEWTSVGTLLLYGFPQILAVFSLLSILAIWFGLGWLFCLGFLLFLLPFPAPGRMWMELRAYRVNMLFIREVLKADENYQRGMAVHYSQQYTGPAYFFMWPFKNHIIHLLLTQKPHPYYDDLRAWLRANGVLIP